MYNMALTISIQQIIWSCSNSLIFGVCRKGKKRERHIDKIKLEKNSSRKNISMDYRIKKYSV